MTVIVYGDFNSPYSYLASQRCDTLIRAGTTQVDWRAVEHDPGLPLTGTDSGRHRVAGQTDIGGARLLALPGERLPVTAPALVSNTSAAVAAYAEAVSDGVEDELRRKLFDAIWAKGRHLSSADSVQRVVAGIMWAAGPPLPRLSSPDIPGLLEHDPDAARVVRRAGGTTAPDGGPLTAVAHHRIQQWRRDWLALPHQGLPAVVGPDGTVTVAAAGLRYLAGLLHASGPGQPAASGRGRGA